jgi:hypothetical protein
MSNNGAANKQFERLVNGKGRTARKRRQQLIYDILEDMGHNGIEYPWRERNYTIDEHIPMVQRYLDRRYPRKYRLSVYGHMGRMRPIWKGPNRARNELCLYLKDGHYRAIRKMDSFFGLPYCIDCESTYNRKNDHRATCVAKCPRCCGMKGLEFPCKNEGNYIKECLECNNLFRNRNCYNRHLSENICQLYKRPISISLF